MDQKDKLIISDKGEEHEEDKTYFGREVRMMMYGYGDEKPHYTDSISLLDRVVCDFVKNTTKTASSIKKNDKLTVDDLLFVIRKDKVKTKRAKELLAMNEEIKSARKAFDFDSLIDMDNP